jgi:Tol biopolymer transport system component
MQNLLIKAQSRSQLAFWCPGFRILVFLVGMLIITACQAGAPTPLVAATFPAPDEAIGAWGWVGVSFSRPMSKISVEEAFSITPEVPGEFIWEGDTLLWFRPLVAFDPDQRYVARLSVGAAVLSGQILEEGYEWSFGVRQPEVLFYRSADTGDGGDLWRVSVNGDHPMQMTETDGQVFDYAPDRTGSMLVYNRMNDLGGLDLWLMDREGNHQRLLLDCAQDRCTQPAWSVSSDWIAYARERYSVEDQVYQPSQIWTVSVEDGETARLYQSETAFGFDPSFSPDGAFLASYDRTHDGIRVLDLMSSQEQVVPRILEGVGDWSPDGQKMIFSDVVPADNEPYVVLYIVDFESQVIEPALGEIITDTDFSLPRWSPDGDWLAVSLRPVNGGVSKALWILGLTDGQSIPVADDPAATYSAYRWDPWGQTLIYQQILLGGSDLQTSLWCWDWATEESWLLIEDGVRPVWLP